MEGWRGATVAQDEASRRLGRVPGADQDTLEGAAGVDWLGGRRSPGGQFIRHSCRGAVETSRCTGTTYAHLPFFDSEGDRRYYLTSGIAGFFLACNCAPPLLIYSGAPAREMHACGSTDRPHGDVMTRRFNEKVVKGGGDTPEDVSSATEVPDTSDTSLAGDGWNATHGTPRGRLNSGTGAP